MVVHDFKEKLTTQNLPVTKRQARAASWNTACCPELCPVWGARKWATLYSIKETRLCEIIDKFTHTQGVNTSPLQAPFCFPHFQRHRRRQCPIHFQFTDTLTSQNACCKSITELWEYNKAVIISVPLKFKAQKTVLALLFWLQDLSQLLERDCSKLVWINKYFLYLSAFIFIGKG